jgi:hypothetical protein
LNGESKDTGSQVRGVAESGDAGARIAPMVLAFAAVCVPLIASAVLNLT